MDGVVLISTLLLFTRLRAVTLDPEYAEVVGIQAGPLLILLFVLVALAVVALIRVVGVILAIALLTLPAAIARHWTDTLGHMMVLAVGVSALCTTGGLFLAQGLSAGVGLDLPTGPLIILLAVALHGLSSLLTHLGLGASTRRGFHASIETGGAK